MFWNLAIIVGLVIGVPRADTRDAELYVYAGSIVVGTRDPVPAPAALAARARRPAPARRSTGATRRCKQIFMLMVPVTLGLGLINVNARDRHVRRLAADRSETRAPAAIDKAFRIYMLPQGMFSVAVATGALPVARTALARAATSSASAPRSRTALRQIDFLLVPAAVVSRCPRGADRAPRSTERGAFDREPDARSSPARSPAFSLGLTFNGMMLMLEPRVLQPAVDRGLPTAVALGEPRAQRRARRGRSTALGTWGIPLATSLANIAGVGAAVRHCCAVASAELEPAHGSPASFVRVTVASAVARRSSPTAIWHVLDQRARPLVLRRSSSRSVPRRSSAVAVYLAFCRSLRVRELNALLSLRGRLRPA